MTTTDKLTDRDWLISLLTIEQEQMLTDYEVHPDAWKGDPERTDCTAALADGILEGLAHRRASQAAPAHEDDLAVDRFAAVMKAKLAKKRDDGRGGWSGPECSEETLSHMLRDHVVKGDPVDVANFAMMLHQRGERIAQAAPAPSAGCEWCVDGVQADGEAPCPCTQAARAPSDGLREALSDMVAQFSADGCLLKGTHLNATLSRARAVLRRAAPMEDR